jgi:addiction module RelB/DinJ family antitoxin
MKTVLNIKVDEDIKRAAQGLAEELGIPLSTVVNATLREFVASRQVTFSALPRLKPEIEALIPALERDIASGRNMSRTFEDGTAAADYLRGL